MCVVVADNHAQVLDRRETDRALTAPLESLEFAPATSSLKSRSVRTVSARQSLKASRSSSRVASTSRMFSPVLPARARRFYPKSGRILGVIDLTCPAPDAHPLMLPTALRLARMIEHRLIDESSVQEKLVLQQFLRKNRSVRGPVVFLGPRSMLSNAAASRFMVPADEMLLRDVAHRIVFEGRFGFQEITLSAGRRLLIRCEKCSTEQFRSGS